MPLSPLLVPTPSDVADSGFAKSLYLNDSLLKVYSRKIIVSITQIYYWDVDIDKAIYA